MADQPLLVELAERDPAAFAAALASSQNPEALGVLDLLPDRPALRVLARLPQSRLRALVAGEQASLVRRLDGADFESALQLLARLPRDPALSLVRALADQRLRRRLLRFLNYPEHCVGGLTPTATVQVAQHTPIEQVLGELREHGSRTELPVVVLNDERRYLGKLDLWRVLIETPSTGSAQEYLLPAPGLHPETSLVSARQLRVWDVHGWLALITHERRVLGAVSRKQVFIRSDRTGTSATAQPGNVALVGQALVSVCGDLLTRLVGGKPQ